MRQRSSYPKPFKAQVVQECLQPGATVSSVATGETRQAMADRAVDNLLAALRGERPRDLVNPQAWRGT
ncbi:TPA: transposase [Pseudomonas aeruginosa]|nr:transposase [Pseudomonas aeruginosa]